MRQFSGDVKEHKLARLINEQINVIVVTSSICRRKRTVLENDLTSIHSACLRTMNFVPTIKISLVLDDCSSHE